MSTISETGHANNVANFFQLQSFLKGLGEVYNPSTNLIKLPELETLGANAKASISDVNKAFPPYNAAIAARVVAFEPLSVLSTRLLNAIKSTGTSGQVDDVTRSIVRKIQGKRASARIDPAIAKTSVTTGKPVTQVSSSQMGFDNRLDNFEKLIQQLSYTPEYKPNEIELQTETLKTLYDDLLAKNTAAINSEVVLNNARIARNKILYQPNTGLLDVAFDTKAYIKSLFGASSAENRQISGLTFTPYKK